MAYFVNRFAPRKNVQRGVVAKSMGDLFENILKIACTRESVVYTRIPDGCRMIRTKGGAVIPKRTTTPFDFLLSHNGLTACIDCKTIDSGNFSHSMLTPHQVESLIKIYNSKVSAGYLIWYRDTDQIIYFGAIHLYQLKPRQSLNIEDGIMCGTSKSFSLKAVLELFKATI